jgi:tetratricopeptide (TPR) repeat protein
LRSAWRSIILEEQEFGGMAMTGIGVTLLLAATIGAPTLPARTDWQGEPVMMKKSSVAYGKIEPDGTFKPIGSLLSLQYVVVKEEKGRLKLMQEGKEIWVDKEDMVRVKDAAEHFTKMLEKDPNNATWYAFRGWAYVRTGKPDNALKDYSEAIRLRPQASAWYNNRGLIYAELKKYDEAIQDYNSALDLEEDNVLAFRNRALAYIKKKEFAKAASDYEKAVELRPDTAFTQNGLAWLLSTAPDEKVRNGKKALEHAKKACELTEHKNGGYLDTLAAAYAEVGDFDKAVEWQEKALKAGDFPLADLEAAKKRLEMFKKKMPYRGDE